VNLHYHDKEPLGEKLQDMINDQAASQMLIKQNGSREKELNEAKPKKTMFGILLCFIVLYLSCTVLTTRGIWQDYEARYRENTKIELQDSHGYGVPITKSYLKMTVEEGNTYYFLLDEYLQKPEIESLLVFVKGDSDKYIVEAQIDEQTHALLSMSIMNGDAVLWDWETDYFGEGDVVSFYQRTKLKNIVCEGWQENGLQVAAELMMPVYVIGLVLMMIGIAVTVGGYNRMKE